LASIVVRHCPSSPIRLSGTATEFARDELHRTAGPLTVLGAFPTALYLGTASGAVLALLAGDAVQLPIGVTVPGSSRSLPLDRYTGPARAAGGMLRVSGCVGTLDVVIRRLRPSGLIPVGIPVPGQVAEAVRMLAATEIDPALARRLAHAGNLQSTAEAVGALLGRGLGLTPAGDDVLCGALAGGVLFDRPIEVLRHAVLGALAARPRATTSLSRQLLLSAVAGHGLAEVSALGKAVCGTDSGILSAACARLAAIGHSSGAALAMGVLAMAGSSGNAAGSPGNAVEGTYW